MSVGQQVNPQDTSKIVDIGLVGDSSGVAGFYCMRSSACSESAVISS